MNTESGSLAGPLVSGTFESVGATSALQQRFSALREALNAEVIDQEALTLRLLIALLADGHLLVEGAPGLAKTTAIKTLAQGLDGEFHRIQFTPDLLPADLTGTEIYRPQDGSFHFQRGPIFHNLVLADEINRAPAKVQSALLEAMAEKQVSIGGRTFALPDPFLVLATQNPIETDGAYRLPEAQRDRFLLKVDVGHPNAMEEMAIISRMGVAGPRASTILAIDDVVDLQAAAGAVFVHHAIENYIVRLVMATRTPAEYGLPG